MDYGWAVNTPVAVDAELAKRLPALEGVNFRGGILMWVPEIFQIDDPAAHMTWNSWHTVSYTHLYRMGAPMGKSEIVDTMVNDALWDACGFNKHMALSAFKDEIVPVVIKGKKGDTVFDTDEGPRLTPVEKLATLKPAFTKDGIVTAGNSSAINDGAAALVVMSEEKAKELGVKPLATWVAGALAGVEPEVMGLGPIAATKKVMAKTGLTVADMDLIEANEAFAAQSVAVSQALNFDMSKVNVNGGAIALGHPVGASGARILVTDVYKRQSKRWSLVHLNDGSAAHAAADAQGSQTLVSTTVLHSVQQSDPVSYTHLEPSS